MKRTFFTLPLFLSVAVGLSVATVTQSVSAVPFVSNLGDLWTAGGIGDIHNLYPGGALYGTDTARFTTGSGYNYSLNTITLEFLTGSGMPAGWNQGWNNVNIQLFQSVGTSSVLVGNLGNPVVDPNPTQWPQSSSNPYYTTYIDFSPFQNLTLSALSHYSLVISVPSSSATGADLLFATSSAYTTPMDWTMSTTIAGNPYAGGEYLKLAVNATQIPDQSNTAFLLIGGIIVLVGFRRIISTTISAHDSRAHPVTNPSPYNPSKTSPRCGDRY